MHDLNMVCQEASLHNFYAVETLHSLSAEYVGFRHVICHVLNKKFLPLELSSTCIAFVGLILMTVHYTFMHLKMVGRFSGESTLMMLTTEGACFLVAIECSFSVECLVMFLAVKLWPAIKSESVLVDVFNFYSFKWSSHRILQMAFSL